MKIKQALAEGHQADPMSLYIVTLKQLHDAFGQERVEESLCQTALAVAQSVGCLFKFEPGNTPDDDVMYFWSASLGDEFPKVEQETQGEHTWNKHFLKLQ